MSKKKIKNDQPGEKITEIPGKVLVAPPPAPVVAPSIPDAIKFFQDAMEALPPEEAKDLYDQIVARCGGRMNRHREYFRLKKENPFAEAFDTVHNFFDSFTTISSIKAESDKAEK